MQKVKELLPAGIAAKTLSILIDEEVNACQKLLCGARTENAEILAKLLCVEEYELGREVLLTIGAGKAVTYIDEARRRASLRAMKRNLEVANQIYARALKAEMTE